MPSRPCYSFWNVTDSTEAVPLPGQTVSTSWHVTFKQDQFSLPGMSSKASILPWLNSARQNSAEGNVFLTCIGNCNSKLISNYFSHFVLKYNSEIHFEFVFVSMKVPLTLIWKWKWLFMFVLARKIMAIFNLNGFQAALLESIKTWSFELSKNEKILLIWQAPRQILQTFHWGWQRQAMQKTKTPRLKLFRARHRQLPVILEGSQFK